jgi:hypothetical protein
MFPTSLLSFLVNQPKRSRIGNRKIYIKLENPLVRSSKTMLRYNHEGKELPEFRRTSLQSDSLLKDRTGDGWLLVGGKFFHIFNELT